MRTGTILIWLVLAGSFVIYLLEMAGVLVIGVNQPSLLLLAGMCVVCLLLAADVMQRLWRHYNRTEAAFNDLKRANDDLQAARVRLEQHVHAQGELLEVSRVIRSTQEMEPLLDEILIQMKRVVNYDLASVLVLRKGEIVAVRQLGQALANRSAIVAGLMNTPHWKSMIEHQQPVVLADIYQEADSLAPFVQRLGEEDPSVSERQHSWMGLPLIVRGEVVGALSISNSIPAYFDAERVEMSFAFANHAAVAIESSRTREDAVYAAALAERTRLARELHDSVSQSLYGMVLTTRTALEMMDKNPATARDTMRYTLELADAALSEMRALIFELRPESLKEDGLLAALRKQAMALTARHKIQLHLDLCDEEPALPIKTKEALYRLAMEAVQNTIRHAGAANLCLALACGDTLMLTIEDDGCGFNAQADYPGHLGLQTMRERAHAIGGQFDIHSQPSQGTRVSFAIPAPQTGSPTTLSAAV
jgi:signal transduction histidine kinase